MIYPFILGLHNVVRWFALILGIVAAVMAWLGWSRGSDWRESDRKLGVYFGISVDIQFLLGLLLYFIFSPLTRTAIQNFGAAMSSPNLRFFALVHPLLMILAVVFAHLGSVLSRRSPDSRTRYFQAAIWFSLATLLIMIAMPWSRPLLPGLG
jgi:uncharacterized membrane protein